MATSRSSRCDLWFDGATTELCQFGSQRLEHLFIPICADDGAAGASKLGACAASARYIHHLDLPRRKIVNAAARVEILIHQVREPFAVPAPQSFTRIGGELGELLHCINYLWLAPVEPSPNVVVKNLCRFAQAVVVTHVDRWQQRRI